jgi:hypothetical protein
VIAYKAKWPLTLADHPALLETLGLDGERQKVSAFDWKEQGRWLQVPLNKPMSTGEATSIMLTTEVDLIRKEFLEILNMASSNSLHDYPVVVVL